MIDDLLSLHPWIPNILADFVLSPCFLAYFRGKSMIIICYLQKESYCLEKGSTYKFEIDDGYGDGLTSGEKGFYSLALDGKEKARGSDYGKQDVKEIRTEVQPTRVPTKQPTKQPTKLPTRQPTPKPTQTEKRGVCTDDSGYRFQNKNCLNIFKGKGRRQLNRLCNKKYPNNQKIRFFCPSYCKKKCIRNKNGGNITRRRRKRRRRANT